MTKNKFEEMKKAKATLCSYCESDMCEWCIVEKLINQAEEELAAGEDDDEFEHDYIERNYSPSCPWNAPGMSIKDFI